MSALADVIHYDVNRTGPIAAAYLRTAASVAAIMGPYGSGKTMASFMRILQAALFQDPGPDGVRRVRCIIVRETYPQLELNVLNSWFQLFPKTVGKFSGDSPITHVIPINYGGYPVEITAIFNAIGDKRIEDVVKGFEGECFYLNEADLSPRELFDGLLGRVQAGRGRLGRPAKWVGGWCDFNAPDDENWTYGTFVESLPDGWFFRRQPSGLSPDAENLPNLKAGYYEETCKGKPDWWVRRFVRNEFGYSRDGKPVYGDDYNDQLHVSDDIKVNPLLPIKLGIDQGLNPAITFGQDLPSGQQVCFDELVGDNESAGAFGERFNHLVGNHYHGAEFEACADPAAWARSAATSGSDPAIWIKAFCAVTGIRVKPAPTNDPLARIGAVASCLRRMIGGQPGYRLHSRCRVLRKGFNSGYRLRRIAQTGGRESYTDKPDKTNGLYHNVHDAEQYRIIGNGGFAQVMQRAHDDVRRHAALPSRGKDFDPFKLGARR